MFHCHYGYRVNQLKYKMSLSEIGSSTPNILFWCLSRSLITVAYVFMIQHIKLRRATEQIKLLERKLQQAVNNNAKLKVKHNEDSKLWQGSDSKVTSTKTLCDQLTETLQQLASQTEQGNIHGDVYFSHLLF